MSMKNAMLAMAAVAGLFATSSDAKAWGAYHVGYTHVGPGGVQHYGHTAAAGPYGGYSSSHYGAHGYGGGSYHSGYGGGYHAGYGGGGYHYSGGSYGGATAGGFRYGGYNRGGYGGGVYRRY